MSGNTLRLQGVHVEDVTLGNVYDHNGPVGDQRVKIYPTESMNNWYTLNSRERMTRNQRRTRNDRDITEKKRLLESIRVCYGSSV